MSRHIHLPFILVVLVLDVLSKTYHAWWTGTGGPTAWPPRSPGLIHLDFYLWEQLKPLVYAAPVDNEETLALWAPVRLSATTPASLDGCGGPWWDISTRALNLMEDVLSAYYKCTLSAVTRFFLFELWDYRHCGHSWPIVPASGDNEDDCGEHDGM
jgi:hypothetical protein